MTKEISIKEFTSELQRTINKDASSLKNSKRVLSKTELSEVAKGFLDLIVEGTWIQREDRKIDVQGKVKASENSMLHLFMGKEIFFGNVTGSFSCYKTNITSLKGAPKVVGGDFYCNATNITSLKGAPGKVGGNFDCTHTNVISLTGSPEKVGGNFWCTLMDIPSLEGSPKVVGGDFYCYGTNIPSLDGIGEVKGHIYSDLK